MKRLLLILVVLGFCCRGFCQNVGIGTVNPHPSALLDISGNNKGFLPPRMNWTQIQSISNPAAGLIVYDTGVRGLRLYTGSQWILLAAQEKELGDAPGVFSETAQGSSGQMYPRAVALDTDKSVYVAGSFAGDASIGPLNLTNIGNSDIFLAKFDSAGTPLWAKVMGSNEFESATGIAVDAAGNIYICGFFLNTVDLDPGPGVNSYTTSGGYDGFYAKYDNNGNWLWGKKVGGTGHDYTRAITTDGTSIYITGEFNNQASFNSTVLTSSGGDDIYVARYQCSTGTMGVSGWAIRMGGNLGEGGLTIKMYGSNIILGGSFHGSCNFGGIIKTSYGEADGFFGVLTNTGTVTDIYQLGGTGEDVVNAVAEDLATGTIFAAGSFSNTADFDSRPAATLNKTSNGNTDAFIVRYQAGFPFWVQAFGGASNEEIKTIDTDDFGNVFAIGTFANSVTFELFRIFSIGGVGVFLLKADVSGTISWVQQAGGNSSDEGEAVAVSGNGKLLFASCTMLSNPYLTFNRTKIFADGFYLARYEE